MEVGYGTALHGGWRRDPVGSHGDTRRVRSEQPADLVEGLGLAGLLVEPGSAADQGTADGGAGPEQAGGPPVADGEAVHRGTDDRGAAVVGQVVAGAGGDEGADDGDAERRAELL